MRALRIPTLSVLFTVLAVQASAQTTGGSVLGTLADQLRATLTEYRITAVSDGLRVVEPATGSEVLAVRQLSHETVLFSATLGAAQGLGAAERIELLRRVAEFNGSSPVGTAWFDEKAGVVTMVHRVNPAAVSMAAMVNVAALCSSASREAAGLILQ